MNLQRIIDYLVMDVDGTLTDGKIYIGETGEVFKAFNIKDGYGIHDILLTNKIVPIIITGRKSNIVLNRCREIGISEVYQGVEDKCKELRKICHDLRRVAYIGDDVNDYECMKAVNLAGGITGCPLDAVASVKEVSSFVSNYKGGEGAVREFIEYILTKCY